MKNKEKLISIIMPVYNAERFIKESIASVVNQIYVNWELVIVDDGSTDSSLEIAESFIDTRIKIYKQRNSGVASARNYAIEKSNGEYLAFLDSDDLWNKNKLSIQISLMERNNYKFTYTSGHLVDENSYQTGELNPTNNPFKINNPSLRILVHDYISTLSVCISKELLTNEGKLIFDPFLHGTEDWDLWIRLAQLSSPILIDEKLVSYRVVENSLSNNFPKHIIERRKVLSKNHNIMRRFAGLSNLSLIAHYRSFLGEYYRNKKFIKLFFFGLFFFLFLIGNFFQALIFYFLHNNKF